LVAPHDTRGEYSSVVMPGRAPPAGDV